MANSSTDFYTVGKGCAYLSDTKTSGKRMLGNAPGLEINIEIEELEHFSSKSGLRVQDKKIVLESTGTATITLDEPKAANIDLFLLGDGVADASQASATGQQTTVVVTDLGLWYEIGALQLSNVVVSDTPVTSPYTLNTDYELDLENGLICALSSGSISAAETLTIDYDQAAVTIEAVDALKSTSIEKYFWFYGASDVVGVQQGIVGKVSITPNGALSLIQDGEWQQLALDLEFLDATDINGVFEYTGKKVTGN